MFVRELSNGQKIWAHRVAVFLEWTEENHPSGTKFVGLRGDKVSEQWLRRVSSKPHIPAVGYGGRRSKKD